MKMIMQDAQVKNNSKKADGREQIHQFFYAINDLLLFI